MSGNGDRGNVNHMLGGDEGYHHILISQTYMDKELLLRPGYKAVILNKLYLCTSAVLKIKFLVRKYSKYA